MIFVKEFTAWRDEIDQQIIEFMAEKKIKRENLIDIKYSFSVSAHGTGYSGALVIYEKDLP
jgi:hypothetical protein